MCPACIAAVVAVAGVISAGGGAALTVGRRRASRDRTDLRSRNAREDQRE